MAEESRFFENMTIHKQYQEYSLIKKKTFEFVNSVNKWSTLFLLAGILYGLFMFMMLFPKDTRRNTISSWISSLILNIPDADEDTLQSDTLQMVMFLILKVI